MVEGIKIFGTPCENKNTDGVFENNKTKRKALQIMLKIFHDFERFWKMMQGARGCIHHLRCLKKAAEKLAKKELIYSSSSSSTLKEKPSKKRWY